MVRGQQVGAQRASLKSHQEYVQGAMDRLQGRMLEGSRLLEALEIAVGRMQEAQEVQDYSGGVLGPQPDPAVDAAATAVDAISGDDGV